MVAGPTLCSYLELDPDELCQLTVRLRIPQPPYHSCMERCLHICPGVAVRAWRGTETTAESKWGDLMTRMTLIHSSRGLVK